MIGGHNAALVLYGPSGSGKSFTLEGAGQQSGVLHHALKQIFQCTFFRGIFSRPVAYFSADVIEQDPLAEVRVGCFEIGVNGVVTDLLLSENAGLRVRDDIKLVRVTACVSFFRVWLWLTACSLYTC